ncbi:MAG: UPF0147 family protein [Thermoplasmata archaeon]|nr:UPF0147 family protein [Thermoplasmata archaeon]
MTTSAGRITSPVPVPSVATEPATLPRELGSLLGDLGELAEDLSLPRNVRRTAASARLEIERPRVALDLRISAAMHLLDELANDPNLPSHGRTTIWSMISRLESLQ